MNSINKVIRACLLTLSLSCTKPPCEFDFVDINFIAIKVENQQRQNLFSGASAVHNADSIRVLNKINNFDVDNAAVIKSPNESSSVIFSFYKTESVKSYIYYNSQLPQDSIELITTAKIGCCCGNKVDYKDITGVKFNNVTITPTNGRFIFVK